MTHKGSCHCGRISFEVDGSPKQVVECNCSHCSRKGYLLWFTSRENLRLLTPEDEFAAYTFNRHAINHHFCRTCGCAPFALGKDRTGKLMAAINIRCLPEFDRSGLEIKQVDGRSL